MIRPVLVIGPALCLATLLLPPIAGLSEPAWRVAGIAAWMATGWLTGVIPLEATSLIPIVLLGFFAFHRYGVLGDHSDLGQFGLDFLSPDRLQHGIEISGVCDYIE